MKVTGPIPIPLGDEEDRRAPHDDLAERTILAAVLEDEQVMLRAVKALAAPDFHVASHRAIYSAMLALHHEGQSIDSITVCSRLRDMKQLKRAGGLAYVESLSEVIFSNPSENIDRVKTLAMSRAFIDTTIAAHKKGIERPTDVHNLLIDMEAQLQEISRSHETRDLTWVRHHMPAVFSRMEELYKTRGQMAGLSTGLVDVDSLINGMRDGALIVIAGRPGMGKSALGMNIAMHVGLRLRKKVALFSLEMTSVEIILRMVGGQAGVPSSRMNGTWKEADWMPLTRACEDISGAQIAIDDSGELSIMELRAKAKRMQQEHGLDLIIVDYLQILRATPETRKQGREKEIAEFARGCKALAKELGVPVIAMAQLNRAAEQRADKRPLVSELRESGSIEQEADVVMLLYRDEVYDPETPDKGIAELSIGKNRSGKPGTARLTYRGDLFKFQNLAPGR